MDVRAEQFGDRASVLDLHREAFGEEGGRVASLVESLAPAVDEGHGISLVAEMEGEVVGHVMFTPSLLDTPRRLVEVSVLSPLGVAPAHQRDGVGSALVRAGLEVTARRSLPLVFLEGSPAYYRRFGFVAGGGLGFRKPSLRIPDEAFQVMTLPAHESWMTGTLVYADAFWRCDCVGLRDREA